MCSSRTPRHLGPCSSSGSAPQPARPPGPNPPCTLPVSPHAPPSLLLLVYTIQLCSRSIILSTSQPLLTRHFMRHSLCPIFKVQVIQPPDTMLSFPFHMYRLLSCTGC